MSSSRSKPRVVSFHFGLPGKNLLERVQAGARRSCPRDVRWMRRDGLKRGVRRDHRAGLRGGGHRGMFLTDDIPHKSARWRWRGWMFAPSSAGDRSRRYRGCGQYRGGHPSWRRGVQVGTSYLLCPEATTSNVHRAALSSASSENTALTNLFTGRPARGIVNRLMREVGPISDLPPEFPLASDALAPLRVAAEGVGSGDFSPLWSGQNASGCKAISAAALTDQPAAGLR